MSSSSTPEPGPGAEAARLAIEEVEEAEALLEQKPLRAEKALGEARGAGRESGWVTTALAAPGFVYMGFYLLAPLVVIILVSFWTRSDTSGGFERIWTTQNYTQLFHDHTYWNNMLTTFETSLIAVFACLLIGFPVAYFLALKVQSLKWQIVLFIVALAPFWTSFLTRAIAWTFPLMGSEGALNQILLKLHIINHPVAEFGFSLLSVRLAMIQLYVLFMITPLFFSLAQVDRSAIEAARDLGGNWWRMFREVILPQTMPGIVIGSIFIFVLTMGDYGTVNTIGGGNITSVGTIVKSKIDIPDYPGGAASAVLLVIILMIGVWVITRFSNLREEL
jgi:putative spermidine/putrescine transport system permease protein